MPSVYALKPAFQRLLAAHCAFLHGIGVTPNQITAGTLLASLGMGLWMYAGRDSTAPYFVLPLFLLLRMAANALDGMIAKNYGLSSPQGALLNEIGDVLADAALYLPFAALPGIRPALPVAVVLGGTLTEVAGLAAVSIGGPRRHDGPMGKSDRALVFGILALLHASGLHDRRMWDTTFGLILALLALTILNRCRRAVREVA